MVVGPRRWFVAIASLVVMALAGCSSEQAAPGAVSARVDTDTLMVAGPLGDKSLGNPAAPNLVVEYASMTCPHCAAFHSGVFPGFKEKYIDTGQIHFIFREFPLDPLATSAIMLARCAPDDRFFPMVELLFQEQRTWVTAADSAGALRELVKQAGISSAMFDACLANQEILDGVNWVRTRGADVLGVNSTPTFFFNGEKVVGELTLAQIDQILGQ